MKKLIKFIISIIGVIILTIVIDLICIFTINRPLFAQSEDYGTHAIYKGLFFNTYNCPEYSVPQVKSKWNKFTCAVGKENVGKVIEIKDTTKDIKEFACAEALESFYEDENYTYYWSCIKNKYMIVKYENGFQETISDALKYGSITISDLDQNNISYIKYKK